ncbi:MAG TPA: hydroxypyruvate isomerase [Candidatus Hydrogenedentes bacterium]|nr:hydroxypyruvate isomerase [Candidatus Hydrogenedentota bacterium]
MLRRSFLTSCAAVLTGTGLAQSFAAPDPQKPFADAPLRIAAPLDWFPGRRPEEKLDGVAAWGLPAYEWLWPFGDPDKIRIKSDELGLELSCIAGAGAIASGWMVQPEDHDKTEEMFVARVKLARQLNCKRLVGLTGNTRADIPVEKQTEYVIQCLKRLAPIAEDNDVTIVMEALNPLVDHRGFFLTRTDQTVEILKAVDSPNVKMLFDIYHQQITEGNVIRNFTENIDYIGHFHVADNPGRQEPGTGELNYTNIFNAIKETGYTGFVALECGHSTGNYEDTLRATLKCLS